MFGGQLAPVLRYVRKMAATNQDSGLTDGQLLERFVSRREEAAFEALLQRHGAMVLGVCQRILHHSQDAEDAFQATFLVLIRKADSIGKQESVSSWLHGVAYRTALKARAEAAKRWDHERQVRQMQSRDPTIEVIWRELGPLLDEEIERLPAKYRLPFVSCYLEGKTYEEVSQELGCSRWTIATRLSRARARLRRRLAGRGLALTAGGLETVLSQQAVSAGISATLAAATLRSASAVVGAQSATITTISANIVALTEGVIRTMSLTKLKTATALLLLLGLIGLAAGVTSYHAPAAASTQTKKGDAVKPAPQETAKLKDADQPKSKEPQANKEEAKGKTAPPGCPVELRLKVPKGPYFLDLGGRTPEEFRKQLQPDNFYRLPAPPKVDLELELRNTSDKEVLIWVKGDPTAILLDLKGPGAVEIGRGRDAIETSDIRKPFTVPLAAQSSYTLRVQSLVYGWRDNKKAYWTEPGEYTLIAHYQTAVSPPPPGSKKADSTYGQGGFGRVLLTSAPVKLTVKAKG
jgi:RNA polymerase sigma factor (sigma-70 family)